MNGNVKLEQAACGAGGVRRLAVANEPNIFQILVVVLTTWPANLDMFCCLAVAMH